MESVEKLFGIKKGAISLLFLFSWAVAHGQDRPLDAAQLQFEAGVRAMFSGDHDQALGLFEELYRKTKAPRVKLEWARTAFLAKQYSLSAQLFREVLDENIPDEVRFNVSLWLTEVSSLSDQTDYGFTFVRDTNPFAVAKQQTILIYGTPFLYSPPQGLETLSGLNFYIRHSRTLNSSGTVRLIAEADDTEYEGEDNTKSSAKVSLNIKRNSSDNLSLRLGLDGFFQRRDLLLKQPYVGVQYRKDQLDGFLNQYQVDALISKNTYPEFSFVDGRTISVAAGASWNLKSGVQAGGSIYVDETEAKLRTQGFNTIANTLYMRMLAPAIRSTTRISITKSSRTYKGVDELFVLRRQDTRDVVGATIQPYSIKILGLYPSLEMGFEKSKSNIMVNTFDRKFFNLSLKKNY